MRWAFVCFLAAVAAGFVGIDARATYGARVSADEPQYLLTAISLGEDFDLDISDELEDQRYLPFHEITVDQQTVDLNSDGQRISPHDPLLPLVLAGPMRIGGWVAAKATLAIMLGFVAAMRIVLHRGVSGLTSNCWTCCCGIFCLVAIGVIRFPDLSGNSCCSLRSSCRCGDNRCASRRKNGTCGTCRTGLAVVVCEIRSSCISVRGCAVRSPFFDRSTSESW